MDNIKFVNELYDAFKRGDLPYIVERFGELDNSGVYADAKKKAPWHFALKGPTVAMMRSLGREPTSTGIAREYRELASRFVLDATDAAEQAPIEALGYRVLLTDTLMPDLGSAAGLARRILDAVR